MKVISAVLVLAVAAAVVAEDVCPPEQEADWSIEKLLRHDDCNKFYKCTFGVPVEMKCYGNLYFNLETWQCDYPSNVDCEGRNIPEETTTPKSTTSTTTTTTTTTTPAPTTTSTTTTTTTPAPTTTSTTTTTTTPAPTTTSTTTTTTTQAPLPPSTPDSVNPDLNDNGCPVNPHIHWLLPHESNCRQFYYCVWGEKQLRVCPADLHFNRVLQVCDWPSDAGCVISFDKSLESRRVLASL